MLIYKTKNQQYLLSTMCARPCAVLSTPSNLVAEQSALQMEN